MLSRDMNRRQDMTRVPMALALVAVLAGAAWAEPAKGTFVASGGTSSGTIAPKAAAAFVVRDRRDMRTPVAEVVLSEIAIDAAAAAEALQPHIHAINQDALKERDYILLWIAPDGHVSMNATFGRTMTQFVDAIGDSLHATLTVNSPERVAGRVFTPRPVKTLSGETYTVDVSFDAAVVRVPKGRALPRGGGAPGAALTAFLSAVTRKDWTAITPLLSPAALEMFDKRYNSPAENAASLSDILQAWLPREKLSIAGGEQRDDVADLEVTGDMFPATPAIYLARMRRHGDGWRFEGASLVGMVR
jgi:hypothetical protein